MSTIPSTVTVNSHTFNTGDGIKVEVPGHPDWMWSTERKGKFISHGWYKNGDLIHADIFNAGVNQYHAILEHEGQEEPYLLASQSGLGWTDDSILILDSEVESTPWDGKFNEWQDVDVTKTTGSANMNFNSPPEVLARKYGVSPAVLRYYDRYRIKQVRRPRWWLDSFGLPVGLFNPTLDLPTFDEWEQNIYGLNGYDMQHFDAYELYSGYMITKDPSYLLSMMNLWTHAEANGYYIQKNPKVGYSSVRTPGWYLVASCQLYQMLKDTNAFGGFAERVKSTIVWHLNNIISKFPLSSSWVSGAIPLIFKQKKSNYIFGWQYSVVAHGCHWVADTFDGIDDTVASRARMHAEQILTYIGGHSDDGPNPSSPNEGWVGYIWSPQEDPELHFKGTPPGVNDWNLAPLMRYSSDQFPLKQSLIDHIKESGWTNESHKHFTYAINVMGDAVWDL